MSKINGKCSKFNILFWLHLCLYYHSAALLVDAFFKRNFLQYLITAFVCVFFLLGVRHFVGRLQGWQRMGWSWTNWSRTSLRLNRRSLSIRSLTLEVLRWLSVHCIDDLLSNIAWSIVILSAWLSGLQLWICVSQQQPEFHLASVMRIAAQPSDSLDKTSSGAYLDVFGKLELALAVLCPLFALGNSISFLWCCLL